MGRDSLGNRGVNAVSWPAGVWKRYGPDWMGTVVDGEALDPLLMDERDGTGDGECGKLIWVMGTPVDGGGHGGGNWGCERCGWNGM